MRYFVLFAGLVAAACTPKAPITQEPIGMLFSSAEQQSKVTGLDLVEVRARVRTEDETLELGGVPCRVNGPGYAADFVTPAAVQLPLFGNTAPQLVVTCRYEGEVQTKSLRARNISAEERREQQRRLLDDLQDGESRASVFVRINIPRRPGGFDEFRYNDGTFTFGR